MAQPRTPVSTIPSSLRTPPAASLRAASLQLRAMIPPLAQPPQALAQRTLAPQAISPRVVAPSTGAAIGSSVPKPPASGFPRPEAPARFPLQGRRSSEFQPYARAGPPGLRPYARPPHQVFRPSARVWPPPYHVADRASAPPDHCYADTRSHGRLSDTAPSRPRLASFARSLLRRRPSRTLFDSRTSTRRLL